MRGLILVAAIARFAHADPDEHLTGDWGGERTRLSDAGVTFDLVYTTEVFASESRSAAETGAAVLGHVDAAVTLDTAKLGLWPGGKLYVLGQNGHGTGIETIVPSATQISNLETAPFTQLTEYFVEQAFAGGAVVVRLGKQDANRDFGTPRYGGNFINNNFGMFPTTPLPSYPTAGLGATLAVTPVPWLSTRLAVYEGDPVVGTYNPHAFDHATLAAGVAVTRHYGSSDRDDGTTSLGVWHQTGETASVDESAPMRSYRGDTGFFFQHDEHIYLHPDDPVDPRGLDVIARFGWAQANRTDLSRFLDLSIAWHGIGARHDDTVGIGAGSFTVADPIDGRIHPGDEVFVEAFYKLRLTTYVSLQPDLQLYRHPGGDGAGAYLAGCRLKLKL